MSNAAHTQDVYVKLIRPEDYEDVDESLLLEDAHVHPEFQPEVVTAEVVALREQRDELLAALERAERKLSAYVGVCRGDKELTDSILPLARAAIAKAKGE